MKKAVIIRLFSREKIHPPANDLKVLVLQTLRVDSSAIRKAKNRRGRALRFAVSE